MTTVTIPRQVMETAIQKMRTEYVRVAEQSGSDPGPNHECWAEVEALAEYLDQN